MKKFLLPLLCMALSCNVFASEKFEIKYKNISLNIGSEILDVNGKKNIMDSPAYISNYGYTMLPVRSIAEAIGSDYISIDWYPEKSKVIIIDEAKTIDLTIGSNIMYINGEEYNMVSPAEISKDRIFISIRDLCHAFDIPDSNIIWNENEQSVKVIKEYKFIDYDEINNIAKEFLNEGSNQLFIQENTVRYNKGSNIYIDIENYIIKNIDEKFNISNYIVTETNKEDINTLTFKLKKTGIDVYKIICINNVVKVINIID